MSIYYKNGEKDTRPWGEWEIIDVGNKYIVKRITVFPNGKLSLQKHTYRNEHWIITEGEAFVTLNDECKTYKENEHIFIPTQTIHRVENKATKNLIFIEIQTGDVLDENDIIRIEDIYNRI